MPRGEETDPFRRLARRLTLLSIVLVAVVATFGVAGYVATSGAAEGRLYERAEDAPRRRVAIVLGARVFQDGRLSEVVEDRVRCGIDLVRTGRVDRVLVSGDHGRASYDEVSAMGAALVEGGVPAGRVFLDHAGFRTLDTMHRARAVFGVRDAVVCTQQFHLPRSLYLARSFGIDAVGVVADRRAYRGEVHNAVREAIARAVAVVDVTTGREARLLGPSIAIEGDGRATHERPL